MNIIKGTGIRENKVKGCRGGERRNVMKSKREQRMFPRK